MKIAVWHNLPSGGGKRALYYHVEGLLARGHRLEAWCPPSADQAFLPLGELIPEHVVPCAPIAWEPAPGRGRLGRLLAGPRHVAHRLRAMDDHCRECAAQIEQGDFDLLFANGCMYLRMPPIGRYVHGRKVVYLNEPMRYLYEAAPQLPWAALDLPKRFWRSPRHLFRFVKDAIYVQALRQQVREELTSARAFDCILVNSLYSRESLQRAYGLDSKVCYLGVDIARFRPTGTPREPYVLGIGALHPDKRPDRAIRALGTLPVGRRPELVWIANFANPGYRHEMEALAQACGVRFSAHINVSEAELVDWLNRATVLVYTPRLEPFGLAPLEANACETPVVALAEGGVRETIVSGVNGLLVTDDDPARLGSAIRRLFDEPGLARTLGQVGRSIVLERWQWPQAIERLAAQLEQAPNHSPEPPRPPPTKLTRA